MPPPARPPWHPEQLKRTNNCRPSPMAVRSLVYGLPDGADAGIGPGIGPTAVMMAGGAAVAPPCGGVGPQAGSRIHSAIATLLAIIGAALRTRAGFAGWRLHVAR